MARLTEKPLHPLTHEASPTFSMQSTEHARKPSQTADNDIANSEG